MKGCVAVPRGPPLEAGARALASELNPAGGAAGGGIGGSSGGGGYAGGAGDGDLAPSALDIPGTVSRPHRAVLPILL